MKAYAIYGPPGTGKTTELIRIQRDLIKQGRDPRGIAFLSHTKTAAAEIVGRAPENERAGHASTIHSMVYRLCGISNGQVIDIDKLKEFSELVHVPIVGRGPEQEEVEIGDEFLAIYDLSRARMESPEVTYADSHRPGSFALFKKFYVAYKDWKDTYGYIDFTDMLQKYIDRPVNHGIAVFIIDEAQDLSPLQWQVVDMMAKWANHIIISGDDDQAVFYWGGADPQGMTKFEKKYDAKRKILEQSWRIPLVVHELANEIISPVKNRVEKEYKPRDEQGVLQRHSTFLTAPLDGKNTLILFRNHAIRKDMEETLIDHGLPYTVRSGMPGLFQNRFANAIRIWYRLMEEGSLSDRDASALKRCAQSMTAQYLSNKDFGRLSSMTWQNALKIPYWMMEYYNKVDLNAEPTIEMSSIHGAKGHEADRVIVNTGMTQRTVESSVKDPDSEARVWYVAVTRAKHELHIVEGESGYVL